MKIKSKNRDKHFSIIIPCDIDRLHYLKDLIPIYHKKHTEIIIPSRTIFEVKQIANPKKYNNIKLINYKHNGKFCNPSRALNVGFSISQYDNIIVTGPEIKPLTNVIKQLSALKRGNYVCKMVLRDKIEDKIRVVVTAKKKTISQLYFLGCYKKEDILTINGWDEDFMKGYAWEDNDFGYRFARAGLSYEIRDDILVWHRPHPYSPYINDGFLINKKTFDRNNKNKVIACKNGLIKYD